MELTILGIRAAEGQKRDKLAGADGDIACVPFIATGCTAVFDFVRCAVKAGDNLPWTGVSIL